MIVLLTNEFPLYAGGIATYCYQLARTLAQQGQLITVVAAQKTADDYTFDQQLDFAVERVGEYTWAPYRHFERYRVLASQIRQHHPTLLWASDWRTGITVAAAASQFRLPFVVTAHGTEVLIAATNRYKRKIALFVYQQAELILSVSEYTRQLLIELGVAPIKIHVVPLGIDPSEFLVVPPSVTDILQQHQLAGKRVILTLARLTPRKGQDVMIKAMPDVLAAIPNAVYVIAGRGSDEQRLRGLIDSLGLQKEVILAGYVAEEQKAAYYYACDLFVMLSRQEGIFVEGFGLTLLEAGACGKPVVGGAHGGVMDTVIHHYTGLLVDPLSPQAAAEAVVKLLADPLLAATLGQNARTHIAQQANWDIVAQKTYALLKNIEQ